LAISNVGTISVNASGKECDDPLSYRAANLLAAQRGNGLRTGTVDLTATSTTDVTYSAGFHSAGLDAVLAGTSHLRAAAGSCNLMITRVGYSAIPAGQGLNAGSSLLLNGPVGQFTADSISSGDYLGSKSPAQLTAGSYAFTGIGGSDVGPWTATLNFAPAVWSNPATYNVPSYSLANPLTFTWSGGDPNGYVTLRIATANAIYDSVVECNVLASAGSFTVPAFLTRAMYSSPATISFTYTAPFAAFSTSGLDMGVISISSTISAHTVVANPVP
jgi:hypothetical protein